jgi:predicted TPR repeat methyltransferase
MSKHTKDYSVISEIYDYLMRKIDYKDWAKYIYDVVREYIYGELIVLELASGTGKLGTAFSIFTNKFIFTDLSNDMLKAVGDDYTKICCDMTLLPFKQKFNSVISTFDSINYLINEKEIINCINEVEKILTEDGIFTYDVSLELNSQKYLKHLNRKGKYNGFYYIQQSNYDKLNKIHYNTFSIKKNNIELKEEHKQRIYSVEEMIEIISQSNLQLLDVFEAFTFEDLHEKSLRAQFVLGKNNVNI